MERIKLTIKDVAGPLFDTNEKKYEEIITKFNQTNVNASQLRDDLKNKMLTENRQSSLMQANDLARTFKQELITELTNKRDEYIKILEAKKNNTAEIEATFNGNDNIKALKLIYDSIEESSKLMQANAILSMGYLPSIEKLLEDNTDDDNILELITSYVNTQPNEMNRFNVLSTKLQYAKTTEVDDINGMLGAARYINASSDLFPIIDSIGGLGSRSISNDFNNSVKSDYFGTDTSPRAAYFN